MNTIGLVGGMGPIAGSQAHSRILAYAASLYAAREDREYPSLVHVSRPLPGADVHGLDEQALADLLPVFDEIFRVLETAGADFVCFACNTLYAHAPLLSMLTPLPLLDLVDEVVAQASARWRTVGLLTSQYSKDTGLYARRLRKAGVAPIEVSSDQQQTLNSIIHEAMAGQPSPYELRALVQSLCDKGADGVILGCSELALTYPHMTDLPIIDSLEVLAEAAVKKAFEPSHAPSDTPTSAIDSTTNMEMTYAVQS